MCIRGNGLSVDDDKERKPSQTARMDRLLGKLFVAG